jgi:hypothetical protein
MLYCDSDIVQRREVPIVEAQNVRLDEESRARRYSYGSGWGMFVTPNEENLAAQVRSAWITLTETPSYSYGASAHTKKHSTSEVLHIWRNPSPSVSIKHLSNDGSLPDVPSDSMELSCFIDGFRIVQYSNGEIKAEFCLYFSYGSLSYYSWKSYTEFAEYYQTIHLIHHNIKPMFSHTLRDWETLQSRKKWYRCLDVPYLKEKSILIGRVVQSSLLESPTPGLLLEFLNHSKTKK